MANFASIRLLCASLLCANWFCLGAAALRAGATEHVVFTKNGQRHQVTGVVLVEASDGGMLLQASDGQIWTIQPDEIEVRSHDEQALQVLSADEAAQSLVKQLGDGFQVHRTAHYIVVSNADQEYVQYCSSLFEKLYKGFYAFWKNNHWKLPEPQYPLVALVFDGKASFQKYARPEAGSSAETIIGYYNLQTNRITTYDLAQGARAKAGLYVVDRNIATLVHEATHQLSYNCGLQKRYADNPYWVSEGMAVFFESPDLSRGDGWRTIGRINEVNRLRFAKYLSDRPADSLVTLLQDDTRFRDPTSASVAYAEAWALTYFLVKTKSKQYVAYLKQLSEGEYLQTLGPRQRIEMFRDCFGDLQQLDRDFITYTRRFVLQR